MSHQTETVELDCLGQKCPAPILAVARAAKSRKGQAAILHVMADDGDFLPDIQAWSRTTSSPILKHTAHPGGRTEVWIGLGGIERLPENTGASPTPGAGAPASAPAPTPSAPASTSGAGSEEVAIDCVGMKCPAPILAVARAAKGRRGTPSVFRVRADDDDFLPDIQAWCRTAGAELAWVSEMDGVVEVILTTGGASYTSASKRAPTPQPAPTPAPASQSASFSAQSFSAPAPQPQAPTPAPTPAPGAAGASAVVDLCGMDSARSTLSLSLAVSQASSPVLHVRGDAPDFESTMYSWAAPLRATIEEIRREGGIATARVRLPESLLSFQPAAAPVAPAAPAAAFAGAGSGVDPQEFAQLQQTAMVLQRDLQSVMTRPNQQVDEGLATYLVLHNDFEALMAALMVASTSAGLGLDTTIFFSFWGVNLLRGSGGPSTDEPKVSFIQKMMKVMMPAGPRHQKMSKMHMGGMGKAMMQHCMTQNNVMGLEALMDSAVEQGVKFMVCTMSMGIMGIQKRDLRPMPNLEFGGVTSFVERAQRSRMSLVF